jgi:hypothetical protein
MQAGVEIFFGKPKTKPIVADDCGSAARWEKGDCVKTRFWEKQSQRFRVLADVDSLDG